MHCCDNNMTEAYFVFCILCEVLYLPDMFGDDGISSKGILLPSVALNYAWQHKKQYCDNLN